jgi:hypothetical protein
MTKIEQKAFNYAKEHGTLGLDYNQVYDAFLAGEKETISAVEKVLDDVFYEIKMGHIERAWGAYDEIEKQLKNLIEDEK